MTTQAAAQKIHNLAYDWASAVFAWERSLDVPIDGPVHPEIVRRMMTDARTLMHRMEELEIMVSQSSHDTDENSGTGYPEISSAMLSAGLAILVDWKAKKGMILQPITDRDLVCRIYEEMRIRMKTDGTRNPD